jgi:hypothetical protein
VFAAVARDSKPGLLKRSNSLLVIDTGQLRHRLDRDFDFPDFLAL